MKFIRQSLSRKFFLYLILLGGGGIAVLYFLSGDILPEQVSWKVFLGILAAVLLLFLFLYWYFTIRPLKVVLYQMQSLLSGSTYKRIYTDRIDEVGILAHFFNQVTKGLGTVSYDIKDRERLLDELDVASKIQRDILPLSSPSVPGLEIVAKNKPATEVGGDSFNFFTHPDGKKTFFYIGDVTGHGVSAGLIMSMVNSLVGVFSEIYDNAYDIVLGINKHIKKHVKKSLFMTMVLFCWDYENKKLTYVGAGHEHIIVFRPASGECEAIMSGGVALGMVSDNSMLVKEQEINLAEGDFVVLYSDGIIECKNTAGELYGLPRLQKAVKEYASEYSAEGVNYHVARDVMAFTKGVKQADDMTLIVIRKNSEAKALTEEQKSTIWKE